MAKKEKPTSDDKFVKEVLKAWEELFQDSILLLKDPSDRLPSKLVKKFEDDYHEAVEVFKEMQKEKKGEFNIFDLYEKLPGNIWVCWQLQLGKDSINKRSH